MKIARVSSNETVRVAIVEGESVFAALVDGREFEDLPALLEAAEGRTGRIRRGEALGDVGEVTLVPPVARPRKIIGIGLNYRGHAAELGQPLPPAPPLFAKWDNALTGPYADVPLPSTSNEVDYEAELAFVVGRRGRDVAAEGAASVLLGFCAANDVSARDFQNRTGQWTAGKAFDGFCPLGPWIVTVDDLGPSPDLAIRGRLNGDTVQDSRTNDLIFGVPDLIAFLSSIMTLEPGDVVLTGTPSGVAMGRRPPRYLRPGDVYEVEIEEIGTLRNRFVRE